MSDNKIDITTPPTEREINDFANSLNEQDVVEVKRRQLVDALVSRKQDKEPDWGRMSDAEFLRERMKRYGY